MMIQKNKKNSQRNSWQTHTDCDIIISLKGKGRKEMEFEELLEAYKNATDEERIKIISFLQNCQAEPSEKASVQETNY